MEREIKKRMQDILYAIERLDIHLKHCKSYKDYQGNVTVKAATERELGIIGEAVVQIRKVHSEIELSGMQKIISFRNLVIHAYDSVKDDTVWIIVTNHIPVLKLEVEKLLND